MKFEINKKTMVSIIAVIFIISALVYNLLYINNKKNEIINEIETEDNNEIEIVVEEKKTIFVDVGGEVLFPGLYELPEESRINDAINIAGGVTDKADLESVNLAYILSDEMKIVIPKKEIKKVNTTKSASIVTTSISTTETNEKNKININRATKEELKNLAGIGDSTAEKIIDYREKNGNFNQIEDIKNVSGIGNSKYEKIKENICI